ncbi:hypothetical protein C8Q75DRAFT_531374 [Abortiporus biennis]|nr:hypothetical protein C8Q75DRAFT_531374 [Abortiporus biennis]
MAPEPTITNNPSPTNSWRRGLLTPRRMTEEPQPITRTPTNRVLFGQFNAPENTANMQSVGSQTRKLTQEDQDKVDDDARRKAMKELVGSWMDRLQLISVISTFFAATEAQLLGITTPDDSPDAFSNLRQSEIAANATLTGALVVHVYAAILSFFAAFFLVRYRLKEATVEEFKVEVTQKSADDIGSRPIVSTNPHLETVGFFRRGQPPFRFLEYCHSLCMWLAAIGFILALCGVICFAWARFPKSVSIFASVCAGVCSLLSAIAVVVSWYSTSWV